MGKGRLTVRLTGDAITIRLPLSVLPVAFHAAPFNEREDASGEPRWRVTDTRAFAEAVVEQLEREGEDGTTLVHLLFDDAMKAAVEDGCEGVDDPAPEPAASRAALDEKGKGEDK